MDTKIEYFDDFTIIKNEDLLSYQTSFGRKWIDDIRKIFPSFRLTHDYPLNRTFIYNYGKSDATVFNVDIFTNIINIVIPTKCTVFMEKVISPFVFYFIKHIQNMSSFQVANVVEYKIYFYMCHNNPLIPTLQTHPLIEVNQNYVRKTTLGREFNENYVEFILKMNFDDKWNLVKKNKIEGDMQMSE